MTETSQTQVSSTVKVIVRTEYVAEQSHPNLNHYFFAYHVTIKNLGPSPAQLISRHWFITNGNGAVHEVKGEGVVGQQPLIQPGHEFTYSSACPLDTPMGMMHGTYQMVDPQGNTFDVAIEPFILNAERYYN